MGRKQSLTRVDAVSHVRSPGLRSHAAVVFDLDFVRAQLPAVQSPWALFDDAGGSVTAKPVIDRVTDYLKHHQVQLQLRPV